MRESSARVQKSAPEKCGPTRCILKQVSRAEKETEANFEYRQRKQALFVQELLRVGIKTTFVTEYLEITAILQAVEWRFKQRTIFISGAAHEYGAWPADQAQKFVHDLSADIAKMSYRVVSGFGLGVGSAVITGVLENIYMKGGQLDNDQLLLRPFPQSQPGGLPMKDLWTNYRKDMIQRAGWRCPSRAGRKSWCSKQRRIVIEWWLIDASGELVNAFWEVP